MTIAVTTEGNESFSSRHLKRLLPKKFKESGGNDKISVPYVMDARFSFRYVSSGGKINRAALDENAPGFGVLDRAVFSMFLHGTCVGRMIVELTAAAKERFPIELSGSQKVPYVCRLSKKFFESTGGHNSIAPHRVSRDDKYVEFTPTLSGSLPTGVIGYSLTKTDKRKQVDEDEPEKKPLLIAVPPFFRSGIKDLKKYLDAIEYVAPVRAQAKRFYILNQDYDAGGDAAGESIPYLLRDNLRSRSAHPVPAQSKKSNSITLEMALNAWLRFFRSDDSNDASEVVDTGDLSVHFHRGLIAEIRLKNKSGKSVPLSDTGFGYSQLLPILIKGLLLKKGGTLVVEQPELHLHPAVQIKLATFFTSLILNERRVILETHSEHLINSLRVSAIEDTQNELASKLRVFFIDWKGGRPDVVNLSVDEDGDIHNLPAGFFGESLSLTGRLLRAQKNRRLRLADGL